MKKALIPIITIWLLAVIITFGNAAYLVNGGDAGITGIADQPGDALITYVIAGTTLSQASNLTTVEITSGTFVFNDQGGEIKNQSFQIIVDPRALGENFFIFISTDPLNQPYLANPQNIRNATSSLPGNYLLIPGLMTEIALQDEQHNWKTNFNLNSPVEIRFSYCDANNDNYLDNIQEKIWVSDLQIFYLNESQQRWEEIPSQISLDNKYVSASVNHFSVFALVGKKAVSDFSELVVYPVPYRPGSGTRYDNPQGIVFAHIPDYLEIKIFNIAGELVFNETVNPTGGRYIWKATNNQGEKVASGIYLYILRDSSGNKKTGKLAIIK